MEERILKVLKSIKHEKDFENSTDFIKDEIFDSFDVIELVSCLEEEFSCVIDALDIVPENFRNIDCIKAVIVKSEE